MIRCKRIARGWRFAEGEREEENEEIMPRGKKELKVSSNRL